MELDFGTTATKKAWADVLSVFREVCHFFFFRSFALMHPDVSVLYIRLTVQEPAFIKITEVSVPKSGFKDLDIFLFSIRKII